MAFYLDLNFTNDIELPIDTKNLKQLAEAFLVDQKFNGNWYLEIAFVDETAMQKLNMQHRSIDKPTDVLSFPVSENFDFIASDVDLHALGSIVICPAYAEKKKRSSIDKDESYTLEIPDLIIHGLMHLLGNDHKEDDEFNRWEKTVEEFWLRHPRR